MLLVKVTIFSIIHIGGKHMGFKENLKKAYEQGKADQQEKMKSKYDIGYIQEKKLEEKERIKQMDSDGIPYCPKCKSASVQYVERRKQLSLGRAAVGGALTGGLGAAVGAVTSNKRKGVMKCLKCGNEWKLK